MAIWSKWIATSRFKNQILTSREEDCTTTSPEDSTDQKNFFNPLIEKSDGRFILTLNLGRRRGEGYNCPKPNNM